MAKIAHKYFTPQEYLALEENAETKSEYFRGQIYAMAGASLNHNRITFNLSGLLYAALASRPCETFTSDMRLLVKANGLYTYPDVMVVCGQLELAGDSPGTVTNPSVIIEVLSDSTSEYDRTDKFELYKELETLQNYILIDQHRAYIQSFKRLEGNIWSLESYRNLSDYLKIAALEIELPLRQIYNRVEWPAVSTDHPAQSLQE